MNRDAIKNIINDQKESYLNQPLIRRDYQLHKEVNYCFIGIRRCGKSYLMYQLIHELIEAGVNYSSIAYINFEDERLLEFSTEDLNTVLEIAIEMAGGESPHIFLDEVQTVPGWEKFVRRLADTKYHVCVTGSNSKMLSREIASTLGGRFMIQMVYPFSFGEFLRAKDADELLRKADTTRKKAEVFRHYSDFATYGAFPELTEITSKRDYLNSIYQTIYLGDIITRNKLNNDFALRLILKKTAESLMKPLSFSRLTNILKSSGAEVGKQTVINYLGYVQDSFLLFSLQNYAAKLVEKETSPKYYFMDTGLIGLFLSHPKSQQLENLTAIELVRRYGKENVFYFEKNVEIDFYIPEENIAIQCCYDTGEDQGTLEREVEAFVKLGGFIPGARNIIVTDSEERTFQQEGMTIEIIPAWKWLLQSK